MFENLGSTLYLIREMRGKSQGSVAEAAGIGKSQLSKYEGGKELPKLESLKKVLTILDIGPYEFFYTMHLLDREEEKLRSPRSAIRSRYCSGVRSTQQGSCDRKQLLLFG